jgi:predicted lipoprotein
MKQRIIIRTVGILLVGFILSQSVYFQRLETVRTTQDQERFDPRSFARDYWDNRLPDALVDAVDAARLIDLFDRDMATAVRDHARTLGIASHHAYLISGSGTVVSLGESGIVVSLDGMPGQEILIATEDIYGNAVRDASGLIDVSDFPNTMEFNMISSEINTIVSEDVVKPALALAAEGENIRFFGATEVRESAPELNPLRIIPIRIIWGLSTE